MDKLRGSGWLCIKTRQARMALYSKSSFCLFTKRIQYRVPRFLLFYPELRDVSRGCIDLDERTSSNNILPFLLVSNEDCSSITEKLLAHYSRDSILNRLIAAAALYSVSDCL